MIASLVNNHIWSELRKDTSFSSLYDGYRSKYGNNFIPFFPVEDNLAGDISWGSEPYILYDSMLLKSPREIYGEKYAQILYTVVGKIPEILFVRDNILGLFGDLKDTSLKGDGYKINTIEVWQPDRTRSRDKLRQNYAITIMLDVYYIEC